MTQRHTPEQRRRAMQMIDLGYSSTVISARLNISWKTIRNWRERQPKRRPLDRDDLRRRVEAGETDVAIAAAMRFSTETISKARQRMGIKRRGCDHVSAESRQRLAQASREAAATRREVASLPSPERRWRELIGASRGFEDMARVERPHLMRLSRQDIGAGLGASSMAGWS